MKKLFLISVFLLCAFLLGYWILLPITEEEIFEIFFKMSQKNLQNNTLAQLTKCDPIQNSEYLKNLENQIENRPRSVLFLNNISQFPIKSLKILIRWRVEKLFLNGLEEIDETTANILAQWSGWELHLSGLQQIDETIANSLAKWKGGTLYLNGLQKINNATAETLAQWEGNHLHLDGLREIDKSIAIALILWNGDDKKAVTQWQIEKGSSLGDIFEMELIDESIQKELAQIRKNYLSFHLNGLYKVDEEVAKILTQWMGGAFHLNGLKQIDETTAKVFAQFPGQIVTNKIIQEQIYKDR